MDTRDAPTSPSLSIYLYFAYPSLSAELYIYIYILYSRPMDNVACPFRVNSIENIHREHLHRDYGFRTQPAAPLGRIARIDLDEEGKR